MFFKSIPKLLGVLAMAVTVGLSGPGTASAGTVPFDGGDTICRAYPSSCHLYHFKLDGNMHTMKFNVYEGTCGKSLISQFTVQRKNSANIWLSTSRPAYFFINFDGGSAFDVEGMELYQCDGVYDMKWIANNENKCWHLTELRTRGNDCDWS